MDQGIFQPSEYQLQSTIYVVGNDRTYMRRIPSNGERFRLADLALTDATKSFQRQLRSIARLDETISNAPAVISIPVPVIPLSLPTNDGKVKASFEGVVKIPAPEGTPWNLVKFYLADGETLVIAVPGHKTKRYGHIQLGMANRRTKKGTKKWELIERLCDGHGYCDWRDFYPNFKTFKSMVSDTRPLLRYIFNIKTDPFPDCTEKDGIKSAFQAFPDAPEEMKKIRPYVGEKEW